MRERYRKGDGNRVEWEELSSFSPVATILKGNWESAPFAQKTRTIKTSKLNKKTPTAKETEPAYTTVALTGWKDRGG